MAEQRAVNATVAGSRPALAALTLWPRGQGIRLQSGSRRFDSGQRLDVVVAQLVARNLAKVEAAGSSPAYDSILLRCYGSTPVFQTGGASSILASGSMPSSGGRLTILRSLKVLHRIHSSE